MKEKKGKHERKEENKTKKKWNKKIRIRVGIVIMLMIIAMIVYFLVFSKKIKEEVFLELGENEITISQFVKSKRYEKDCQFVTDVSTIDLSKTGEYQIEIQYKDKIYVSNLKIQDTTAPQVEFQDIEKPVNYEIKAEDFIVSKEDKSEMTIEYELNNEMDTSVLRRIFFDHCCKRCLPK